MGIRFCRPEDEENYRIEELLRQRAESVRNLAIYNDPHTCTAVNLRVDQVDKRIASIRGGIAALRALQSPMSVAPDLLDDDY